MNMMGQMPGVQDTSEIALQQAQAQAQLQAQFSPGAIQAAQGIYGTSAQRDTSLIQRGTSAAVL